MLKITVSLICCSFCTISVFGQFHTLNIPQASNKVVESQRLGITDIIINYHSPAINGRDVWNDASIIPQNGNPIPWRAGANMNTTIEFTTDVNIEGNPLAKGLYGFHIIPNGDNFKLLFAHNNNQWGSYYLNVDKDVTLSVDVTSKTGAFSEKLDYEFSNWSENSVDIGLEWGNKIIPFNVSIDLNKTVVESLRSELLGLNTYRWEAWNDAANWCLNHNTNLEEALTWVDRSINGGYNGFGANRNATNVTTKINLLNRLGRQEELVKVIEESKSMPLSAMESNQFTFFLVSLSKYTDAIEICNRLLKDNPDAWYLSLNKSVALYQIGKQREAIKELKKIADIIPESFKFRHGQVLEEMKAGTYKIPGT